MQYAAEAWEHVKCVRCVREWREGLCEEGRGERGHLPGSEMALPSEHF